MKAKLCKLAVLALAAVAAMALAVGCSSSSTSSSSSSSGEFKAALDTSKDVTISVVGNYSNFEALEAQFEEFNKIYPNVSLSYTKLDDYNTAVLQALNASEGAPDIFMAGTYVLDNPKFSELASMAEDLSQTDVQLDNIASGLIYASSDGAKVAMPVVGITYCMVVNEDLLAKYDLKVPTTYEELMNCCKVLKENGIDAPIQGADIANGLYTSFVGNYAFYQLCADESAQKAILNGESGCGEALRSSLQIVADLVDSGYIDYDANAASKDNYDKAILNFFEGDVPFLITNTDTVSGMAKRESQSDAYKANSFTYSCNLVPVTNEGSYFYMRWGSALCVNKKSANIDYANEFMRFLSQKSALDELSAAKGAPSVTGDYATNSIYASLAKADSSRTAYYNECLLGDVQQTAIRNAMLAVGTGTSVDDAIAAFESELAAS